jgi:hypothetical protein
MNMIEYDTYKYNPTSRQWNRSYRLNMMILANMIQ